MRLRRLALAAAFAALLSLVAVSTAGAAAWLPPAPISETSANASDTPSISFGASGDAAAAWWDDSGGGRIVLARKRAGAAWSAPVTAAASANVKVFVGVDGAGNVTAAWSSGGGASVTTIATWSASAAAPTLATLDISALDQQDPVTVNDLAVDGAGNAVLAGTTAGFPQSVVLGYRQGAAGSFAFGQKFGSGLTLTTPLVAINAAGTAVASWRTTTTGLFASVHAAGGTDWGAPESIPLGVDGPDHSVAIDAAGLVYVAYTVGPSVGAALRSLAGNWQPSAPLSPASGVTATNASVVVTPAGAALLTWRQTAGSPLDATIQARSGSTATNIWGTAVPLSDSASADPVAAIGNDGRAVVAWQRIAVGDSTGQARVLAPDGTWGAVETSTPQIASSALLSISTDGRGHFATASSRVAGTKQVFVSAYDAAPPTVTPIALSGTATAGGTLNFSVTAADEWSPIAVATWDFGDHAKQNGLAVSHVYDNAGTYAASVAVSDAAGNVTTLQLPVSIAVLQSTLTTARFSASWKQSRVKGSLLVKGTVPRAGTYVIDVTKGKARKIHVSLALPVGAFSKTIKLPAKLLPGSYHVAFTPPFPAAQVTPAGRDLKLAAPASGVVDSLVLSGKLNGPATGTLRNQSTVYARFHFAAVPKGKLLITWYRTVKGKRTSLGSATKGPAVKVGSYVVLGGRRGKITAVLSRKGTVIAQGSVLVV